MEHSILSMTADIISSHASTTEMTQDELLETIHKVFEKLSDLACEEVVIPDTSDVVELPEPHVTTPAVPFEAAFAEDRVFCMVCGKGLKTLKRHLSKEHNLKPGAYRKMFNIPAGTPLVSKEYSDRRKEMAKGLGLAERLEKARAVRAGKAKKGKKGKGGKSKGGKS